MLNVVSAKVSARIEIRQRLIFTVTTGRSGTRYLYTLLDLSPGISAHHEPDPNFTEVMRACQRAPELARRFWLERKLPSIQERPQPVYAETSHVFCKGFLGPLLNLGIVPDLIHLRRAHRKVAISMLQLGTVPGRTAMGLKWLLSPGDPGVLPLDGWQEMHDYQLCYWYCLEIERRSARYCEVVRSAGGKVLSMDLATLATLPGYLRLLWGLRLPLPDAKGWLKYFFRRRRRVQNSKVVEKGQVEIPRPLRPFEEEVERATGWAPDPAPNGVARGRDREEPPQLAMRAPGHISGSCPPQR